MKRMTEMGWQFDYGIDGRDDLPDGLVGGGHNGFGNRRSQKRLVLKGADPLSYSIN